MASSATTKAARKAAREATIAAQEAVARRTRANMDDLTVFFSARQRADAVDDWLTERVEALKVQADERRSAQLRECGAALRAMKDRGETLREIAQMAGITEKSARELIRSAGQAQQDAAAGRVGERDGRAPANGHDAVRAEGAGVAGAAATAQTRSTAEPGQ
jgi:hypothetical protein